MPVTYDKATECSKGPTPGAIALVEHWKRTTGLGSLGIYNCRPVRGGVARSVHSEGRAADLKADATDPAQRKKGDDYAAWLIANADALQVQYIIWNHRSWRQDRGWKAYSGVSPHIDHLHVELNRAGAAVEHPLLTGAEPTVFDDDGPGVRAAPGVFDWAALHRAIEAARKAVLRKGDRGDSVKIAQHCLNARVGAGLARDGVFGANTEAAVRRFQQREAQEPDGAGVKVDGVIGPVTWARLLEPDAAPGG